MALQAYLCSVDKSNALFNECFVCAKVVFLLIIAAVPLNTNPALQVCWEDMVMKMFLYTAESSASSKGRSGRGTCPVACSVPKAPSTDAHRRNLQACTCRWLSFR